MIQVLSIFSIIYWVNAVGSIVYPIGYMNEEEFFRLDFSWYRKTRYSSTRATITIPMPANVITNAMRGFVVSIAATG